MSIGIQISLSYRYTGMIGLKMIAISPKSLLMLLRKITGINRVGRRSADNNHLIYGVVMALL